MVRILMKTQNLHDIENNIENDTEMKKDVYYVYSTFSDTTLCEILFNSKTTNFKNKYPKLAFIIRDILHSRGFNPYPESIDKDNNFIGI